MDGKVNSKAIRVLRSLCGATQREVARTVRVSPTTISLLENGQTTVPQETLSRILAAVGYKPEMDSHLRALIALAGSNE